MQSFKSTAVIYPSRFVKIDAGYDSCVLQASTNDSSYGISQEWQQDAPIPSETTGDAASSGELIKIYDEGEECWLELGGTVVRGDRLKPDSDGKGVVVATTGTTIQNIGAVALQSGSSGQLIRVTVRRYSERPALT